MKFKEPESAKQLDNACPMLKLIVLQFQIISLSFNIEPVCTRIISKIPGDSGIHAKGLAADFRNQYGSEFLYSIAQEQAILKHINEMFPRMDDHMTAKSHGFNGGPIHFHLQCSPSIAIYSRMIYPTYTADDLGPVA